MTLENYFDTALGAIILVIIGWAVWIAYLAKENSDLE